MLLGVIRDKPAMISLVDKAVREIFNKPESIFVTAKVRDILFDGLLANCTVTTFGAKAVCSTIKADAQKFGKLGDNEFLFSFFGIVSPINILPRT